MVFLEICLYFSLVSLSFALAARALYRSRRLFAAAMRALFCCFARCRITTSRSASGMFTSPRAHQHIPYDQLCNCQGDFANMRLANAPSAPERTLGPVETAS